MTFKEHKEQKTYVVVHYTGTGVVEDPHVEGKVCGSFDLREDAEKLSNTLNLPFKGDSWSGNHFSIHTNTLTEEGKKLSAKFSAAFKENWDKTSNDPQYKDYKVGEHTFRLKHHPLFDEPEIKIDPKDV